MGGSKAGAAGEVERPGTDPCTAPNAANAFSDSSARMWRPAPPPHPNATALHRTVHSTPHTPHPTAPHPPLSFSAACASEAAENSRCTTPDLRPVSGSLHSGHSGHSGRTMLDGWLV